MGCEPDGLSLRCCADADFAGDLRTQRSTIAYALIPTGPYTRRVLSVVSLRQTCVSHSTPEAEIESADHALRFEALPARSLWNALLQCDIQIGFMEDNQAVVRNCKAGGSQRLATTSYAAWQCYTICELKIKPLT